MNTRFVFLGLCGLALFGQAPQFEQLPISTPKGSLPSPTFTLGFSNGILAYSEPYFQLTTTSDGTLEITQAQPAQTLASLPGSLFTHTAGTLTKIGSINMAGFSEHDLVYGPGIATWGFSNQNGNISYACDSTMQIAANTLPFAAFGRQCTLIRVTGSPASTEPVCANYAFDGASGDLPFFWRGLSYDPALNLYFWGTPYSHAGTTIYRISKSEIPTATGTCKLSASLKSGWEVVHAYPFGNHGQFLAQIVDNTENVGLAVLGIAILNPDGSSTVLVSTNAQSKPQILANGYPGLIWDAATQTGLITYNTASDGVGHKQLFKDGQLQPEVKDQNIAKLGKSFVIAIGLNGNYALIGAGSSIQPGDHYANATSLIEVNLAENSSGVLDQTAQILGGFTPLGFQVGSAAVGPDGTVYFIAQNSTTVGIFSCKIPLSPNGPPPAPPPTITAVVNGASFQPGLAPGGIFTINGTGFGSGTGDAATISLSLGGTSVTVCGKPARMYYASPKQINAVAPNTTPIGSCPVIVTANSVSSAPTTVQVAAAQGALFLWQPDMAVITDAVNYSLIGDPVKASWANPATPGEAITLWGTGYGTTDPPVDDAIASQGGLLTLTAQPTVTIGGIPAQVLWAGRAAGYAGIGLDQINVVVPPGISSGKQPLIVNSLSYTLTVR